LLAIIYVVAVVATFACRDAVKGGKLSAADEIFLKDRFGQLGDSVYSLLASVLGGADWETYRQHINKVHAVYSWMFVFYILFAQLALLNVVTGIFVDSLQTAARKDKQEMIQDEMKKDGLLRADLEKAFCEASQDESNMPINQLTEYLMDGHVKAYLRCLGISYHQPQ